MRKLLYVLIALCTLVFTSCQKFAFGEDEEQQKDGSTKVTFNIQPYEQKPFSTAKTRATDITTLCTRLHLAIYKGGERIKYISQKKSDNDFGQLSTTLSPGTYKAVIIAHSQSRNPTSTNIEKISFTGDLTDTFLWTAELTVEPDGVDEQIDVNMHRVVAMVRFITTDNIPDNIASLEFYYTGGSSTINATNGIGCVNSKQRATRSITDDMKGKPATFEIFTFPKDDENLLKIVITGKDANGNDVFTRTLENVPIKRNQITEYKGKMFDGATTSGGDTSAKFNITTSDEWTIVNMTL